jgi:hypothetical protein
VDYDVEIGTKNGCDLQASHGFNFPQVVARAAGIVRNGNGGKKSRDYTKSRIYRLPV